MPDAENALSPLPGSTPSEMFPVLTSAQQVRVLAHGQRRNVKRGLIVVELNEHITKVFVVLSGQLRVLHVSNNQERVVAICNPGMFTGELNVLTGRRGLVRIRAAEKSELIEIEREALQAVRLGEEDDLGLKIHCRYDLWRLTLVSTEVGGFL